MATTKDYLEQLKVCRDDLAANLTTKGVSATSSETLSALVPKVLEIESGGGGSDYNIYCYDKRLPISFYTNLIKDYNEGNATIAAWVDGYHPVEADNEFLAEFKKIDFHDCYLVNVGVSDSTNLTYCDFSEGRISDNVTFYNSSNFKYYMNSSGISIRPIIPNFIDLSNCIFNTNNDTSSSFYYFYGVRANGPLNIILPKDPATAHFYYSAINKVYAFRFVDCNSINIDICNIEVARSIPDMIWAGASGTTTLNKTTHSTITFYPYGSTTPGTTKMIDSVISIGCHNRNTTTPYLHTQLMKTINSLPTCTEGTNTLKITDYDSIDTPLTDDEIAIATAKGWTITTA